METERRNTRKVAEGNHGPIDGLAWPNISIEGVLEAAWRCDASGGLASEGPCRRVVLVAFEKNMPPRFVAVWADPGGVLRFQPEQMAETLKGLVTPESLAGMLDDPVRELSVRQAMVVHPSAGGAHRAPVVTRLQDARDDSGTREAWYAFLPCIDFPWYSSTLQSAISNGTRKFEGKAWPLVKHLELCARLLNATAKLHGKRMLHGDIRPANVMYGQSASVPGDYSLIDYGSLADDVARIGNFPLTGVQPGTLIGPQVAPTRASVFYSPERRAAVEREVADTAVFHSHGMFRVCCIGWRATGADALFKAGASDADVSKMLVDSVRDRMVTLSAQAEKELVAWIEHREARGQLLIAESKLANVRASDAVAGSAQAEYAALHDRVERSEKAMEETLDRFESGLSKPSPSPAVASSLLPTPWPQRGDRVRIKDSIHEIVASVAEGQKLFLIVERASHEVFHERVATYIPPSPRGSGDTWRADAVSRVFEMCQASPASDIYSLGVLFLYSIYRHDTPGGADKDTAFHELVRSLTGEDNVRSLWPNLEEVVAMVDAVYSGDPQSQQAVQQFGIQGLMYDGSGLRPLDGVGRSIYDSVKRVVCDISQSIQSSRDLCSQLDGRMHLFVLVLHFVLCCLHRRNAVPSIALPSARDRLPFCDDRRLRVGSWAYCERAQARLAWVQHVAQQMHNTQLDFAINPVDMPPFKPVSDFQIRRDVRSAYDLATSVKEPWLGVGKTGHREAVQIKNILGKHLDSAKKDAP